MEHSESAKKRLAKIFTRINMSDLPAMSENVRQLFQLSGSPQATASRLAAIILRDYSLTSKILQVANSAYYSRGVPVNSIERAVTAIGFNTVRELAAAIAIFEEFLKTGVEKKSISILLAQSFLSAILAKRICIAKRLRVAEEEAFICSLFFTLGKIIIFIYLPDRYRKISEAVEAGATEEEAARKFLDDLTFPAIGREIAIFWNFCEKIIKSMRDNPPSPENIHDTLAFLQNIAAFSNYLVATISGGNDPARLIRRYGPVFSLGRPEAIRLLAESLDASWDVSDIIRYGLVQINIDKKLPPITACREKSS